MDCGPPCPSSTPEVYSNSCPLSRWCHPAISFSVVPFSSCLHSFPASVFSSESVLCIRWPKYWRFSFSISPSSEYSGLVSFRMNWLDLLAVQGTLKSLLQHHSSKASVLLHTAFFIVQLSHPYMTTGKTIALTRQTFVGKAVSLNLLPECIFSMKRCTNSWAPSDTGGTWDRSWPHRNRSLDDSLCVLYHRFCWQFVWVRTCDLNICTACELGELFPLNETFRMHKHPDGLSQLPVHQAPCQYVSYQV